MQEYVPPLRDIAFVMQHVAGLDEIVSTEAFGHVDGPTIHASLLTPLLVSATGFTLVFLTLHLMAMRAEIFRRRVTAMRRLAARRAEGGAA